MNRQAFIKAISFFALTVLCVVHVSAAHVQSGVWRVHPTPDKSFSVETPFPLRSVPWFDGEHGAVFASGQGWEKTSCYAAIETPSEESKFGVVVIDTRSKELRNHPRQELINYLSVMLIGDDDDPKPASEKVVHVGRHMGREYSFVRENQVFPNGSTGEIFTRGRIFVVGDKIYVLVFRGAKAVDLKSPDAERFLNSFHLLRRSKNKLPACALSSHQHHQHWKKNMRDVVRLHVTTTAGWEVSTARGSGGWRLRY